MTPMSNASMETVASQACLLKTQELKLREREALKLAHRARRAADEALFFEDTDEFYDSLLKENMHRSYAEMCAREAADLMRMDQEGWVMPTV